MRTAVPDRVRPAGRSAGSSLTSAALLVLVLAPAPAVVTAAESLPHARAIGAGAQMGAQPPVHAASRAQRARQPHDSGLRLLREAATASRAVPYQGVQIVSWWDADGTTTVVVNVTHQPGQGTLLRADGTGAQPASTSFVADEPGAVGNLLGVTEEAVRLLASNYDVAEKGEGSACGRPAAVVEARRTDGTLAARFWLDRATKIPLRREVFDRRSRVIGEGTFIDLRIGGRAAGPLHTAHAVAARPWTVATTAELASLRRAGWPLPARLPGGLTLFSAHRAVMSAGPVLHLSYSDGLSSFSLFVQRGALPPRLAGWREIRAGGWPVFSHGQSRRSLTWCAHGYVLTLIATAPAPVVSAVVRALPHDAGQGIWARMRHGFGRLVSWINPL